MAIDRPLRSVLRRLKTLAKSNRWVRNALGDLANEERFSDLYVQEKMLADSVRVDAYASGIAKSVKAGDVVVDVGTGSGILAMLAARQQARVYAIDHAPIVRIAEQAAEANGLRGITFIQQNSRDFSVDEKVDVILHEQIGYDLFDENMVENLLDLKRRVLADTGKILPGLFKLFIEPVCMKPEFRVPYIWEEKIQGLSFEFLRDSPEVSAHTRANYRMISPHVGAASHFLTDPTPALVLDLNAITDPGEVPTRIEVSKQVVTAGRLDGFSLYIHIVFDEDTIISTSPFDPNTSWSVRMFRCPARQLEVGDTIGYRLVMGSIADTDTWDFSVQDSTAR